MSHTIAIDGPAGSGKSTIAKRLAARLGFTHLDTGAMYRAITLFCLQEGMDLNDETAVVESLDRIRLRVSPDAIVLNGTDVTEEIRSVAVNAHVSLVSSYAGVREHLVAMQRRIASAQDSILDGRDIGTVVLPQADLKIYLTASPEVRAKRRLHDEKNTSRQSYEEILKAIQERDLYDSNRALSPLRPAEDAVILDTSAMSLDEVTERIVEEFSHVSTLS